MKIAKLFAAVVTLAMITSACAAIARERASRGATVDAGAPLHEASSLWSAGMESGTLDEWREDGGGGLANSGSFEATVSTMVAHDGARSLRARIYTPSAPSSGVRAFRWAEGRANRSLYYSVWVYFPAQLRVTTQGDFANLIQFKSRSANGSRNDPVWAFYGTPDGNGGMYLRAGWGWGGTPLAGPRPGNGVGGKWFEPTRRVSLPVGRWTHLEAYLSESKDFDGRLTLWQDGVQVLDLSGIRTSYPNCSYNSWCASNEWSVNLYSDGLSPNPATMYLDSAAISREYVP